MNYTINYIRKVPIWRTILGLLTACIAIYILLNGVLFGFVAIALSVVVLQSEGCQIDLESKTYRKTYSILGLNFGKWKPLPEVEYVSVFATTQTTAVWVSSASTNVTESIYAINLFHNRNQKIEANVTFDKKDAFDVALHLADALETDMLDATVTGDFKWMDKNAYRDNGKIVYT